MSKPDHVLRSELSSLKTAMFGLAGVSIAFLLHIFDVTPVDRALQVSLYCFVISVPLLIALGLNLDIASHWPDPDVPFEAFLLTVPLWLGPWFTVAGVTGCIWHYNSIAALVFLGVSIASAAMFGVFQSQLIQRDKSAASRAGSVESTPPQESGD